MLRSTVLLLLIAAGALSVCSFGAREQPSPTPTGTPAATPTPTPRDLAGVPEACRSSVHGVAFAEGSLGTRVREANAWSAEHPGETGSLVVTDDVMRDAAAREDWSVPVRDIAVTTDDAGFHLSATASVFGRYTIRALLVPQAVDGTLRISVRDLDTGGLPAFIRPAVESATASATDTSRWGLRLTVDGVTTRQGCAVVWGRG